MIKMTLTGSSIVMLSNRKFLDMEQIVDPRQFIVLPSRYSNQSSPPIEQGRGFKVVDSPYDVHANSRFIQKDHPAMHPKINGPLFHGAS
jgi:hypothetical protein